MARRLIASGVVYGHSGNAFVSVQLAGQDPVCRVGDAKTAAINLMTSVDLAFERIDFELMQAVHVSRASRR